MGDQKTPLGSGTLLQGAGLGLRSIHYQLIERQKPAIPWFEVLVDNYLNKGGAALEHLRRIRSDYPVSFHGVGMSLGSTDSLNLHYLAALKRLAAEFEPALVSDHLAWVSVNHHYVHDLIPLPYTRAALRHFVSRVNQVQDYLQRRVLIENPSSYLSFKQSEIPEPEFLREITRQTGCGLLLDVNNVYVSTHNQGSSPYDYLEQFPLQQVEEIHLAGYEEQQGYLFDTHGYRVRPPVWELYRSVVERLGPVPTLIEWDTDIPAFTVLEQEAGRAQAVMDRVAPVRTGVPAR